MIERGRDAKHGALFWLAVSALAALTARSTGGCNDAALIQPPACRPGECTCQEDPAQPTCSGFDGRPGDASDPADANSPDASVDGSADAADAADAAD